MGVEWERITNSFKTSIYYARKRTCYNSNIACRSFNRKIREALSLNARKNLIPNSLQCVEQTQKDAHHQSGDANARPSHTCITPKYDTSFRIQCTLVITAHALPVAPQQFSPTVLEFTANVGPENRTSTHVSKTPSLSSHKTGIHINNSSR
jgi:hypothetical protein